MNGVGQILFLQLIYWCLLVDISLICDLRQLTRSFSVWQQNIDNLHNIIWIIQADAGVWQDTSHDKYWMRAELYRRIMSLSESN